MKAKKAWHGVRLEQPDWGEESHSVALSGEGRKSASYGFIIILNAYWEPLEFELPAAGSERKRVAAMDRYARSTRPTTSSTG